MSERTGVNFGTLSRWFLEYYEESKSWVPAGFRSWGEYEDKATTLRAWSPGIVHGLLQAADYARALILIEPAVTDEILRYSGGNGGSCVEAANSARVVLVRDTTDRGGVTLTIPAEAWQAFTAALR
jgi:hypothetical protein